ncbi:Patatin-like phospholipase [Eubacterium ruminantium]|nr:Patatin-like phospholipase [Eubacterium ruminantium]
MTEDFEADFEADFEGDSGSNDLNNSSADTGNNPDNISSIVADNNSDDISDNTSDNGAKYNTDEADLHFDVSDKEFESDFEADFESDSDKDIENASDSDAVKNITIAKDNTTDSDTGNDISITSDNNSEDESDINILIEKYKNIPTVEAEIVGEKKDEFVPKGKTGLVLAGGGAKGAYQVGVLKALSEAGLLDDVGYISGDSIGAINSVLYAISDGDIKSMYDTWESINMPEVFEPGMDLFSNNPKLFSRNKVQNMMNLLLTRDKAEHLPYIMYAGVTRLENGKYYPEYMKLNGKSKEEIIQILLASSAIPIVYEAVKINGKEYLDGGLTDNEPVKPLYDLGIRRFIIIGLNSDRVFPAYKYPDAECFVIYPSHDLGDLFSGTMNYETKAKHFRQLLGEKDGQLAVKTVFEKDPIYLSLKNELSRNNFLEIQNTMCVEKAQSELGDSISRHMDYFKNLEDKYKNI